MKKRLSPRIYILLSVTLFSLAVTWIDAVVHPSYFAKIPVKLLFFLALPLLFFALYRTQRPELKRLFRFGKHGLLLSLGLGLAIYALIVGGYFLTRNLFDFSAVTTSLTSGMGITAENFPWVALYITVGNSFLEEFFFRGFGFITLKKFLPGPMGWLFSPVLFALYHGGMMFGMFHPFLLALLFAGLVAGGLIFNALNARFGNLYPSWCVHMAADAAIMTVGAILFGLI